MESRSRMMTFLVLYLILVTSRVFSFPIVPILRNCASSSSCWSNRQHHRGADSKSIGGDIHIETLHVLYLSKKRSSGSSNSGSSNLSAAERERRQEDLRRRERAGEVVIGKTSAKPGEKDYEINVQVTEQEWLKQANSVEQKVYQYTATGLEQLKMFQLRDAAETFDRVFALKPNAYLWQAGIARYYLGEYEAAADILARCAAIYETKFFQPATEERIWRHACQLKIQSSSGKTRKKDRKIQLLQQDNDNAPLLTPLPDKDNTQELLQTETRKVIRISRELFQASVEKDVSSLILSRAKLRSIGGAFEATGKKPAVDRKMWKLTSWYYLGLHYDAIGEMEESKKCMKMAIRLCPGNGQDIIHILPMLHMTCRDWFDDEEMDEASEHQQQPTDSIVPSDSEQAKKPLSSSSSLLFDKAANADPILVESILDSIQDMNRAELQQALKVRGLYITGSKDELQKRLFHSLMEDTGLIP